MTSWTGWIAVGGGALLIGNLMVELRENPNKQVPKSVVIFNPEEE
jgi:hypothetical protein